MQWFLEIEFVAYLEILMGFLEFCINRPCASKLCQCVPMCSAPLICSLCKALWSVPKATESLANLAHLASGGLRQFCEFCERLSACGGYLVSPQRQPWQIPWITACSNRCKWHIFGCCVSLMCGQGTAGALWLWKGVPGGRVSC